MRLTAHPKTEKCSYDFVFFARATPQIQKGKNIFLFWDFCFAEMRRWIRGGGGKRWGYGGYLS
jgi:hypothetical protein